MTSIGNGIKCTLRTPWKTILFSMVLILLSALLTVSLCVFSAVRGYLNECDEYYHTIADLEYIGNDYPDASVHDPALEEAVTAHRDELNALLAADGVISFEGQSTAVAAIGGLHRWDKYTFEPDRAIIRVFNVLYDSHLNCYMGIVAESCYGRKDYTDKTMMIETTPDLLREENRLSMKGSYYLVGDYFNGDTPHPWIYVRDTAFHDGDETVLLPAVTEKGTDETQEQAYVRYAQQVETVNNACRAEYTASLEDLLPFQQQILSVSKGRMFTEAEYANRSHVCVLSERIAGLMELDVGDTIDLTVFHAGMDYRDPSRWTQTDAGAYEIVGLYSDTDDYAYRIYLPDANAVGTEITPVAGYRLGQFRLKNESAATFLKLAHPLTEHGFRITVYDQGYAAATEPMRELMFISIVFLAVCLALAIVAHALQSYLFVFRQKDTAMTMHALGSGRAHVILYFLSAALLLSIVSAVIGCVIGKLLEGRVMDALRRFAMQFADRDFRFSDSRLSLTRTLAFEPSIGWKTYLLSAVTLTVGSALFTILFAARSLLEKRTKKRRTVLQRAPRHEGKSSRLSGPLKYAALSMRRGVVRTAAVVLLCLTVAVFFGRLTASLDGYREQLDAYRENAGITGFATDSRGQLIDGLLVRSTVVNQTLGSGLISDHTVTHTIAHCEVIESAADPADLPYADMDGKDLPKYGSFAFDPYDLRLFYAAKWVVTNSVGDSPTFHFAKEKDVAWADGYSDADFTGEAEICALPQTFMDEHGIRLGDTVRFLYLESESKGYPILARADVKVVGAYAAELATPIVYSPIGYDPALARNGYTDRFGNPASAKRRTYDSFRFTLDRADDLDALRQALDEAGFTYVRSGVRLKPYAIIEDEIYLNTTHSMERQIQYVGVLYDALYIIAGVIGLVLAWLMTLSRRKEISVMRAMGTQPFRILLNFQTEQFVLSGAGILLGVLIAYLSGCALTPLFCILVGVFWIIWNLSTLLCLITGLLKPSYASLTEPE